MSNTQTPPLPLGTTVAFTQQALSAALHEFLAERGTPPGTWYALNLVALRGPLAEDEVRSQLAQAPSVGASETSELLDRLTAEGLIEIGAGAAGRREARLTPAGEAVHRDLRQSVAGLTAELLDAFDPQELETTTRTLRAVTERARTLTANR